MTEQFLDRTKVRSSFKQMRRRTVSQPVWADVRRAGHLGDRIVHDGSNDPLIQPSSARPKEQSRW